MSQEIFELSVLALGGLLLCVAIYWYVQPTSEERRQATRPVEQAQRHVKLARKILAEAAVTPECRRAAEQLAEVDSLLDNERIGAAACNRQTSLESEMRSSYALSKAGGQPQ